MARHDTLLHSLLAARAGGSQEPSEVGVETSVSHHHILLQGLFHLQEPAHLAHTMSSTAARLCHEDDICAVQQSVQRLPAVRIPEGHASRSRVEEHCAACGSVGVHALHDDGGRQLVEAAAGHKQRGAVLQHLRSNALSSYCTGLAGSLCTLRARCPWRRRGFIQTHRWGGNARLPACTTAIVLPGQWGGCSSCRAGGRPVML